AAGIRCRVEDLRGSLPAAPASTLAWVLREAATNIVRHTSARRAVVRVSGEDGMAKLRVEDDGQGAADLNGGHGLIGVKERAEALGGRLEVNTLPGKGF